MAQQKCIIIPPKKSLDYAITADPSAMDATSASAQAATIPPLTPPKPTFITTFPSSLHIPMPPSPLQTFHPFPHLAPELQELIWLQIISSIGPRVVELRDGFWTSLQPSDDPQAITSAGGEIANTTDAGLQKWEWQYTSPCYIPAPLHVCSLSRELALRRWKLAFAIDEDEERDEQGRIFFDFEKDVLWVAEKLPDFKGFLKVVRMEERKGLRRLAIGFDRQLMTREFRSGEIAAAVLMKEFPLLEEIVLVGSERRTESVSDWERKKGMVTLVENVDGSEQAFWITRGSELEAFMNECRRKGRHDVVLKYMDYTREDPELFEVMDKLQWLQMED